MEDKLHKLQAIELHVDGLKYELLGKRKKNEE